MRKESLMGILIHISNIFFKILWKSRFPNMLYWVSVCYSALLPLLNNYFSALNTVFIAKITLLKFSYCNETK